MEYQRKLKEEINSQKQPQVPHKPTITPNTKICHNQEISALQNADNELDPKIIASQSPNTVTDLTDSRKTPSSYEKIPLLSLSTQNEANSYEFDKSTQNIL